MTYEEALHRFIDFAHRQGVTTSIHEEMIAITKEAIGKQIPKKPIAVINVDSEDTYRCPSCRATLMFRFQRATLASLCHHCVCGQALDWGDE